MTRPCVQAPGGRNSQGYARSTVNGVRDYAHRHAYRQAHGEIPIDRPVIDHACHNADMSCPGGRRCIHRGCIESTHLVALDAITNLRLGRSLFQQKKLATTCVHGHAWTPENTYVWTDGTRHCRACQRERRRRAVLRESTVAV